MLQWFPIKRDASDGRVHPVGRATFTPAEFEAFVAQLEREGNLRVELLSLAPA